MEAAQGDAILDVYQQCVAVSYAYRQGVYHREHLKSRHHDQHCKLSSGDTSRCKKAGEKVDQALTTQIGLLTQFYEVAGELGVASALLDLICYDLLPEDVFKLLYEKEAA